MSKVYCSQCHYYRHWYAMCQGDHEYCKALPYVYTEHTHLEIRYKNPREVNKNNNCKFFKQKTWWELNRSKIGWILFWTIPYLLMGIIFILSIAQRKR